MKVVLKNVYFDVCVINSIVNKYNNTYHNTIKMKSIDVISNFYTEYNVDSNVNNSKFKQATM